MRKWVLGVLFLCFSATAEARPNTAFAWAVAEAKLALSETVEIGFTEELRYDVSDAGLDKLCSTVAVGWDALPHFSIGAHYRVDLREWGPPEVAHRVALDLGTGWKTGSVKISGRQRVQPELRPTQDQPFTLVLRTQAKLAAAAGAVRPYVSVEPYIVAAPTPDWNRLRFDFGVNVPFEELDLDLSYRIDQPVTAPEANRGHIGTVKVVWRPEPRQPQGMLGASTDPGGDP